MKTIDYFIRESDLIEGIKTPVTSLKRLRLEAFLDAPLTLESVLAYQAFIAPKKPLRDQIGMNVRIGHHMPPPGGPAITTELNLLVRRISGQLPNATIAPHVAHTQFQTLHPFMDGNGRTGRALWAKHMMLIGQDPFYLGFLHRFYYQTLEASDGRLVRNDRS